MSQSNTTKFIMFIIVLGRHVSVLIESSSGPSKKIDPYFKCLKMRCGIPNSYIPAFLIKLCIKCMCRFVLLYNRDCTIERNDSK